MKRRHYATAYVGEVDVDITQVLEDMSDEDLAELGLARIAASRNDNPADVHNLSTSLTEHLWAVRATRRAS